MPAPPITASDPPVHCRVATWLIMLPLIFYAAHGSFSVFYTGNGALSVAGGGIINTADTAEATGTRITVRVVSVIVLLGLFPLARRFNLLLIRNKLLIAIVVLAAASSSWSQDPMLTLKESSLLALTTCFGLCLTEVYSPPEIMRLLIIMGSIAMVGSLILAIAIPQFGIFHGSIDSTGGWQGIFSHKNTLGFAMVNLLAPALFLRVQGLTGKLFRVAYIGGALFLIIMSRSRGAWLVCASLLVFAALVTFGRRLKAHDRVVLYAFVGLILTMLAIATIGALPLILELLGKDPTLTGRTTIWEALINSIRKRPLLGYGYSAFWLGVTGESANINFAVRWAGLAYAENGVLELCLELGLMGVGLFAVTYLQAYSRLRCIFKHANENRELFWYASILFLIAVTNIESGIIAYPNSLEWLLFVLAAAGIGNRYREASQPKLRLSKEQSEIIVSNCSPKECPALMEAR